MVGLIDEDEPLLGLCSMVLHHNFNNKAKKYITDIRYSSSIITVWYKAIANERSVLARSLAFLKIRIYLHYIVHFVMIFSVSLG